MEENSNSKSLYKDSSNDSESDARQKNLALGQKYSQDLQILTTALEAMKHKFLGSKGKEYAMRMVVMSRLAYAKRLTYRRRKSNGWIRSL